MDLKREASRCRQRITGCLSELEHLAGFCLGHFPLVRGSLYTYRRRCGKAGCRCARGELHRGQALGVRVGGRSRSAPIGGIDRQALSEHVAAYRQVRRARADMVRAFDELLAAADRLERLREIPAGRLRRRGTPEA